MKCPKCGSVNVNLRDKESGVKAPFCSPCEMFVLPTKDDWEGDNWVDMRDGGDAGENKITYSSGASRNDIGKTRLDLIPPEALLELGEVFGEGAVRHGDDNWKKGMPNSVVINHMMRHLLLYIKGDRDEPHMGKVMFGCCVLIWNEENNINLED